MFYIDTNTFNANNYVRGYLTVINMIMEFNSTVYTISIDVPIEFRDCTCCIPLVQ